MTDIIRKSLAELVGTYIFVLFGPGSIVAFIAAFNQTLNPSTLFYLATTFGLGISIGIMAVANISGGHVNPAVTISLFIAGRFPGKHVVQYIVAQLIGAVLASATVGLLYLSFVISYHPCVIIFIQFKNPFSVYTKFFI